MTTLRTLVAERARSAPAEPVLLAPGCRPIDAATLEAIAVRIAGTLRAAGIGPGARVAVSLPNGPVAAAVTLAVAAAAGCVPLDPALGPDAAGFEIADARADAVIVEAGQGGAVRAAAAALGLPVLELDGEGATLQLSPREHAPIDPSAIEWPSEQHVALVLHTSGTTARAKLVPLTQANLCASAAAIAAHLALGPADRGLNVMPLFHIHGLVGSLLASLHAGASVVCSPGFDPEAFFDWIAEFEPTWYTAVPTIHQAVIAAGDRYRARAPGHQFRFVRSSSAALAPRTLAALESLTGAPVIEAYGMTEASHQMASNPLPPASRKPGTVGRSAGADIAVLDEAGAPLPAGAVGEIAVRGPGVTGGYEANPTANEAAFIGGWFRTGDQGRLDADGYLTITGRLKEIVNRGGEKVSPREVDDALLEHPDVVQAAAFAVPHATLGEDLVAAVVRRPGAAPAEHDLRASLFARLPAHKVPSRIVFVDAIPKGPTGKVQRTQLHRALADRLASAWVAPTAGTQAAVAEAIAQLLALGRVGAHDNFFALGGDSLSGARTAARIAAQLGIALSPAALFHHPTPAALGASIDAMRDAAAAADAALVADVDALSDEDVARLLAELDAQAAAAARA